MKRIKLFFSVFLLLPILFSSAYDLKNRALTPVDINELPKHKPVEMIRNGNLCFAIVYDKRIERSVRNRTVKSIFPAVKALENAFFRCTGTKPEVFDISELASVQKKFSSVILVGDNTLTRKLGIDVRKLPDQGFIIKTFEGGVVIAGSDSSLVENYNSHPLDFKGGSTGTMYGAYDFIERILGVRFFYPGDYGTHYPKQKDLTLQPMSYSDYPRFNTRGSLYTFYCQVESPAHLKKYEPFMGKLKLQDTSFADCWRVGGTLPKGGSHCPTPQVLAKNYPDKLNTIFYKSSSGVFYYEPGAHTGNYYNVLDLKFADLLIDAIREYYRSNGKVDKGLFAHQVNNKFISFGICDTYLPESMIIHDPVVKKLNLITETDKQRGPDALMANIYARFYQYFANRIKQEFPGKKLFVLAYYNSRFASLDPRWKLPDNVEINYCDFRLPLKVHNQKEMKNVLEICEQWYKALGNRPILKLWLYSSRYDPFAKAVAGELVGEVPRKLGKYLSREGCMFLDDTGDDMWFYYYSAYAAHRSQWNPEWDIDAGIDEHWDLFYGKKCGPVLKEFHKLLKDMYIQHGTNSAESSPLYPLETLNRLEALLKQAEKTLEPGSLEMQRFKLFAAPWPDHFSSQRNRINYEKPTYNVHRILDRERKNMKQLWKTIKPIPMLDPMASSKPPEYIPFVALAWGTDGIYGTFKIDAPMLADPKKDVWSNCNLELFFLPGNGEIKYHFAFDLLNKPYFSKQRILPIPQPTNTSYKPDGFKLNRKKTENGWEGDFFIPFSAFEESAPETYDCWSFNVVYSKMLKPRVRAGSSLTLGLNHNTNMYGMIQFAGKGD